MRFPAAVALALLATVAGAATPPADTPTPAPGYAELGSKPYAFTGPGRELAEPRDLDAIRIGIYVPTAGLRAARGTSLRRGAALAVAEANRGVAPGNPPFELVVRTEASPWGSAREVVRLVYDDRVWAIAGAVGGESSHVVQQVVTKAHVPFVGTATTDASLTEVNIPWTFRLLPPADAFAARLADHLVRDRGLDRIVVLASTAYDARLRADAFERRCSRTGATPLVSLRFRPGMAVPDDELASLDRAGADAVVLWGRPADAAALLKAIRGLPSSPEIFAGPDYDDPVLLRAAGPATEGLTVVSVAGAAGPDSPYVAFATRYEARFGAPPDGTAAAAYDGVRLVIDAIRRGGLNRVRIRDALAATHDFAGVVGEIGFDGTGAGTLPVSLLVVRDGRLHRLPG